MTGKDSAAVGDVVRVVRVYGKHQIVLPAIVLATDDHKRLRHVEGTEDWEVANDDDHQGVLDLTDPAAPLPGTVHVVCFALGGTPARTELNVPLDKKKAQGMWVER